MGEGKVSSIIVSDLFTEEADRILEEGEKLTGFTFSHRKSDLRVDCGVYEFGDLTYIIDESRKEIVTFYSSERSE